MGAKQSKNTQQSYTFSNHQNSVKSQRYVLICTILSILLLTILNLTVSIYTIFWLAKLFEKIDAIKPSETYSTFPPFSL